MEFRNDSQRLACFEALTARGQPPVESIADSDPAPAPLSSDRSEPAAASAPVQQSQLPRASADLGIEQLESRENEVEPDVVVATVVDVTTGGFDHLFFHMDNGSVWRQVEARYFPYPRRSDSFEVEISRGILGEYQMRVEGKGRMVRIRRVE